MLRSVALYYSKGVMGKLKYRSAYKALAYKYSSQKKKAERMTVANCALPQLVPYNRLKSYIKSIDIGTLFSVRDVIVCWVGRGRVCGWLFLKSGRFACGLGEIVCRQ